MKWFGPQGDCSCCGPCVCPSCIVFSGNGVDPATGILYAECRLYWECCETGDSTITLAGETYDHGTVGRSGSIATVSGETYTLISSQADCPTQTITVVTSNDCPCAEGCLTGGVAGAKTVATITVSEFGSGSSSSVFNFCTTTRYWDYTALNHTANFAVKTHEYINEDDQVCSLDYIDPGEYFVGQVTNTTTLDDGFNPIETSSITFDVYAVIGACTGPDGVSMGGAFYLRYDKVSHVRATPTICGRGGATMYADGDGASAPTTYYSNHFEINNPTSYSIFGPGYPDGGCGANPVGTGNFTHFPWCTMGSAFDGQERYTRGTASFEFTLAPTSKRGLFKWEAML